MIIDGGYHGIRYINGGIILGKIGDIHQFSKPGKLLVLAGLDLSVYQSGNFQAKHTQISKCGFRVLRYALRNAAHNVIKTIPPSRLSIMPRWQKAGHTIILSDIVPANLSGTPGKCLLAESNLTSIKRIVY